MPGAPPEVLKVPGNKKCADCDSIIGPRWASVKLGTFICETCADLHRKIGTDVTVIKNVKSDEWKPEWIAVARGVGNDRANDYYTANAPDGQRHFKPSPNSSRESEARKLEAWIRDKYEHKRFAPAGEEEPCKRAARGEPAGSARASDGVGPKEKKSKKSKEHKDSARSGAGADPEFPVAFAAPAEEPPRKEKHKKKKKEAKGDPDDAFGGGDAWPSAASSPAPDWGATPPGGCAAATPPGGWAASAPPTPAPAGEVRVDPADGNAYSLDDFVLVYGGSHAAPPAQWLAALPAPGGAGCPPPPSVGGFGPPPAAPAEGERRIDPADGGAYSLDEFVEVYGGSRERPPPNWLQASAPAEQGYAASPPASVPASAAGPEWGAPCSGQGALAAAERRIDPADGNAYTLEDFVDAYGGSSTAPPFQWHQALAAGAPAGSLAGAAAAAPPGWGPPSVASGGAHSGPGAASGLGAGGSIAGVLAPSGGADVFAGSGPPPAWAAGAGARPAAPPAAAAPDPGAPWRAAAAEPLGLGGALAAEPLGLGAAAAEPAAAAAAGAFGAAAALGNGFEHRHSHHHHHGPAALEPATAAAGLGAFGAGAAPGGGLASPFAVAGPPHSAAPSDHRSLQSEAWGAALSDGLPMGASALASPPSQPGPRGFGPGRRLAAFPAAGGAHFANPFDSGFLPPGSPPGSCGGAPPAAGSGAALSADAAAGSGWEGPAAWGTPGPGSVAEPVAPQPQRCEPSPPDHHGRGLLPHPGAARDAPPQHYPGPQDAPPQYDHHGWQDAPPQHYPGQQDAPPQYDHHGWQDAPPQHYPGPQDAPPQYDHFQLDAPPQRYRGQDVPPQPQHFEHPGHHRPGHQQPHHHHGHTHPRRSPPQPQHPSPTSGQAAPAVSIEMVAPIVKTIVGTEIQQLQQELRGLYSEMRELSDDYRKLRAAKEAPDPQAEKAGELLKLRTTVADLQETLAHTVTSALDERLRTAEQGREEQLASTISSVLDAKLGLARAEPPGAQGLPPAASLMGSAHRALIGSRPAAPPSGPEPPEAAGGGAQPLPAGGPAAAAGPPSLDWVALPARAAPPASPQPPGGAPQAWLLEGGATHSAAALGGVAAGQPEPALGAAVDLSWVAKALGAAAPPASPAAAPQARWEFAEGEAERYLGKFAELGAGSTGPGAPSRALGLEQAGPVLRRTGVSPADLATIWDMCDIDGDGCLTPRGFACAMSLARSRSQGAALPPVLPAALLEAAGRHATGPGPVAPEPTWAVSEEQLRKYWSIFLATDRRGQDALSHGEAREVLGRSGLPESEVSRAVRLADADVDGLLGFDEFACALHLVAGRRRGLELPRSLPAELVASLPRLPAGPGLPLGRAAARGPLPGGGGAGLAALPGAGPGAQDPRPAAAVSAPEGGWAMEPRQREQYRTIFLAAGGSLGSGAGAGLLRRQCAQEVLRRSGLPERALASIWGVAAPGSGPEVSAVEFACAMHLACAARHGVEVPGQMPGELEASARGTLEAPALSSTAPANSQGAGSSWAAGPADLRSYRTTFDSLAQGRDRIWPEDAKGVFESYSSETDDLNQIWALSDTDGDGQLTFAEFACAMHLLSQLSQGLPVPAALPPELLSSILAAEAAAAGPAGTARGGLAVGAGELQRYREAFGELARGKDRLGPDELGEVFGCSGLSADEMNQVWQMSDLDGDGQLTFPEFACAVHLLGLRRQGWPLPAEAPQELLGSLRS